MKKKNKQQTKSKNYKTLIWSLVILGFIGWIFFHPLMVKIPLLSSIATKLAFILDLAYSAICGLLLGAFAYSLVKNKGQIVLDNTEDFIKFCNNADSLVFYGAIGQGKTSLLAMLAQELKGENKYATFPSNMPWMEMAQINFAYQPSQPLGVKEIIFLDEINLLFKGNEFQRARQAYRFLSHFFALSRHQGTKIIVNGQRLGQVWIELREVATAVCRVEKLALLEEGLYVKVYVNMAIEWRTEKTGQEFTVFVPKLYLDTFNSTWLKCLKYMREGQSYI